MYKLFAVALAMLTAGAQVVCACSNSLRREVARPMMQACAGEGECCRKVQDSRPEKQEPCEKCNLKNQVQAAPDRHVASTLGEFVLCTLATPADIFEGTDCA